MTTARGQLRCFRISFRVSADEMYSLRQAAARRGIMLSAHIRSVMLDAKPGRAARRPAVEATLLVQALDRLGVIASKLLEVAASVELQSYSLLPACERDLSRCLTQLRSLRPLLLEALGKRGGAS